MTSAQCTYVDDDHYKCPALRPAGALNNLELMISRSACDGSFTSALYGLTDLDGDGRPDWVASHGTGYDVYQLVGRSHGAADPRAHAAGLLTAIENGYGARTEVRYRSAKDDATTLHQVPGPEIVVDSVKTIQRSTGTGTRTRYAYGDIRLELDSVASTWRAYGYRRSVELTDTAPGENPSVPPGLATITDRYPLAVPAAVLSDLNAAFGRHLIAGKPKSVNVLSVAYVDAWMLLTVDLDTDNRRIAGTDYQYDTRAFVPLSSINFPCQDFPDPLLPGQWTLVNTCLTTGFVFESATTSWRGTRPPPTTDNVMTHSRLLQVDDLGRALQTFYGNDARRSDDNFCVQVSYAAPQPTTWGGRVLGAMTQAKVVQANVDGACTGAVLKSSTQLYDALPAGQVSNGFLTSQLQERRETQTGVLLDVGPVKRFDAWFDALGNPYLVSSDSGDGRVRSVARSFDPFGLVTTGTGVRASGVLYSGASTTYDDLTLLPLSTTDANGYQRSAKYDGFGRPVLSMFGAGKSAGVLTFTSYFGFEAGNTSGRRVEVKRFDNPVAASSIFSAPGHVGTTSLDELGRTVKAVVDLGQSYADDLVVGAASYDTFGHLEFEADPYPTNQSAATAYGTTYFYNVDGTLKAAVRGHGKQPLPANMSGSTNEAAELYPTFFSHDFIDGQQVESVYEADALLLGSPQAGVVRITRSSAIGRQLVGETWGSTGRLELVTHAYDVLGNLTAMTRYLSPGSATVAPSNPVPWTFGYDSFGRLLRHLEPNTAQRELVYSNWDELLEERRAASNIGPTPALSTVSRYDGLSRLTHSEQRSNGSVLPETIYDYAYDTDLSPYPLLPSKNVVGRLSAVTSPTSSRWLSYDEYGRPVRSVQRAPNGKTYVETTAYDADGQVIEHGLMLPDVQSDPAVSQKTEKVTYRYDSARRLQEARFYDEGGTQQLLYQAADVDAFGRTRQAKVFGALLSTAYADTGRRLWLETELFTSDAKRLSFSSYGYDPAGREEGRSEKGGGFSAPTMKHRYDALGRLVRSSRDGSAPADKLFVYDPLGNLQTQVDALTNQFVSMRYSSANRDQLCSVGYGVTAPAQCNVTHDSMGNVIIEPTQGGGARSLTYLPSGQLAAVSQTTGAKMQIRYDAFGAVQELDLVNAKYETRHDRRYGSAEVRQDEKGNEQIVRKFAVGELVMTRLGAQQQWRVAVPDARGNRLFIDEKGRLAQEVDYQAYGEPMQSGPTPGTATHSREMWNGQDYLDELGLSHLGARFYDPVIGRFLSRDPLVLSGGAGRMNPYAFAFNDPVNFSDPGGRNPNETEPPTGSPQIGGLGDPTKGKGVPAGGKVTRPASHAPITPRGKALRGVGIVLHDKDLGDEFDYDGVAASHADLNAALVLIRNSNVDTSRLTAIASYSAGVGDELLSMVNPSILDAILHKNVGAEARGELGIESVDMSSGSYRAGKYTVIVVDLAMGGRALFKYAKARYGIFQAAKLVCGRNGPGNCYEIAKALATVVRSGKAVRPVERGAVAVGEIVSELGAPIRAQSAADVRAIIRGAGNGSQAIVVSRIQGATGAVGEVDHAFNAFNSGGVGILADATQWYTIAERRWTDASRVFDVFLLGK